MRQDILLDDDFDMQITEGDFAIGSSIQQDVELILWSQKGEWRQYPTIGLGIESYLKKRTGAPPIIDNVTRFKRDLKVELAADDITDVVINISKDLTTFSIDVSDK